MKTVKTLLVIVFFAFPMLARAATLESFPSLPRLETYAMIKEFNIHKSPTDSLKLVPNRDGFAVSSESSPYEGGYVKMYNYRTGEVLWTFKRPVQGGSTMRVDVSPSGRYVVTGDEHQRVYLLDAATGRELDVIQIPRSESWYLFSTLFSKDEKTIYMGWHRAIFVYDLVRRQLVQKLEGDTLNWFSSLSWRSDGALVATDIHESVIWPNPSVSSDRKNVEMKIGDFGKTLDFPLLADKYSLAERGFTLHLVDVMSGEVVQKFVGNTTVPNAAVTLKDNSVLASVDYMGSLRFWEIRTGTPLASYDLSDNQPMGWGSATSVAATSDGKEVVVGMGNGTVRTFRATTGRPMP